MRKASFLLVLFSLGLGVTVKAVAQSTGPGTESLWVDSQGQTRSAGCNFTIADGGVDVNAGVDLTSVDSLMLTIYAPSGQVFDGGTTGGNVRACFFDPYERQWMRVPDVDKAVTVNGPRQGWKAVKVGPPRGRAAFYNDTVMVSNPDGGSNIKLRIDGFRTPKSYK